MANANTIPEEEKATTSDVADGIRQRIRLGRYVPGQRLIEGDLIRETGASRSRVREALQRLAIEGLITIEEFRGASVKRITWDEVRQIYQARMVLEGLAAREFAASDAADMKAELVALQGEMDAREDSGNHDEFAKLNDAWHSLIIDGAGNEYVRQFLSRLTIPIYRLLFSTFYNANRIDDANADHRLITTAIVEGRVDDAERAMRAHIHQGLIALSDIRSHFDD